MGFAPRSRVQPIQKFYADSIFGSLLIESAFTLFLLASALNRVTNGYSDLMILHEPRRRDLIDEIEHVLFSLPKSGDDFRELPRIRQNRPQSLPIPLDELEIAVLSVPSSLSRMSTLFNNMDVSIYCLNGSGRRLPPNVRQLNITDHRVVWPMLVLDALIQSRKTTKWFVFLTDDTIPFLDAIMRFLGRFHDPDQAPYLFYGIGQGPNAAEFKKSGGFFLSRKLVEHLNNRLVECSLEMQGESDVLMISCIEQFLGRKGHVVDGMFAIKESPITGDLTGIVEGWVSRTGALTLSSLFENCWIGDPGIGRSKEAVLLIKAQDFLGEAFLRRYVCRRKGAFWLLNDGFSIVRFSETDELIEYYVSVEKTFNITGGLSSDFASFVVNKTFGVERYRLMSVEKRKSGKIEERFSSRASGVIRIVRYGEKVEWRKQLLF
jgi:hypothetical protein